jgi:cytochrome c peroxidase
MKDVDQLADEVMTGRMAGPQLETDQKGALQGWLFALPAPPEATGDAAAQARGKILFESANVGCASCHSGPRFTSSATVDVGTGGAFQVPSLVGVRMRAPFLHDGCATTLKDRFGACGGTKHGNTNGLTPNDISDLIAYLETL